MKYWFTSDYHLGHANIIKYCNRPFDNVDKMNEAIVRNHNSRVKSEDTVFHIGDFCFKNTAGGKEGEGNVDRAEHYIKQLNGRFVFIQGNHDITNSLKTCIQSIIIKFGGQDIFLTHNPENFNHNFKLNLVGHVHEAWKVQKRGDVILINVGVDVWGFKPISIEEILRFVEKSKRKQVQGKEEICTVCNGRRTFIYHSNGNLMQKRLTAEKGCIHKWVEKKNE